MKFKKTIGWILLISGLAIIFWSLYSSYNIFSARTLAPEIFKIEEEESPQEEGKKVPTSSEEIQQEMEKIVKEQIKEIIPPLFLSKILNLIAWAMFAGILIFGGGRVSGIGIRLIRKE